MRTRLFSIILLLGLGFCLPAMAVVVDRINVTSYGAIPNDGQDDTAAINNAVNAGRSIYFPPGSYNYTGSITVPVANTSYRFYGDGPGVATIVFTGNPYAGIYGPNMGSATLQVDGLSLKANSNSCGTAIYAVFNASGSTDKVRSATIHNVQIIESDSGLGFWTGGIYLERAQNAVIDKVEIIGLMNNQANGDPPGSEFGIRWVSSDNYKTRGLQLSNLMIWWCNSALQTWGNVEGLYLNGFEFALSGSYNSPVIDLSSSAPNLGAAFHLVNGHVGNLQHGIRLTNLRGAKVSKVHFVHNFGPPFGASGDDIALNNCTDAVISDNSFVGAPSDISVENGVHLNNSHSVQIIGNYFSQFKSSNTDDACIRVLSNSDKVRIINNVFETDASAITNGTYGGVGRAYNDEAPYPYSYYRGNTQ